MTRYDVAVLSLRILAVAVFVQALMGVAAVIGILNGPWTEPVSVLPWAIPVGVLFCLGALLYWMAPALGRRLFAGDEPISTANRPEIGAIALQVCGVLCFTGSLSGLRSALDAHAASNGIGLAASGFECASGLVLFFAARPLSRLLFGAAVNPLSKSLLAHLQAVTFSVLGIWLCVSSLSDFAVSVRDRIEFGAWGREVWASGATLVLGFALFLGGAGLSVFWSWVRHAGLSPRSSER
ncbi:MAG: hypothetical protein IPJ19_18415 [Planctomycetes bacterium]|nr:hypothetical protein [Planctomycetota bacterium]